MSSAALRQIALKIQSGKSVRATGTGATGFDVYPTAGLTPKKAMIESETVRRDGQTKKGRHGTRGVGIVYPMSLGVGKQDLLWPLAVRATDWTATIDLTEASGSLTSITTQTDGITNGGGSWLTSGIRAGMMVKLTGHSTSANNGKWLPVLAVSASKITTPAGSLTANGVADTAFTLTVAKHVFNPLVPVDKYLTAEEYGTEGDESEIGEDLKLVKIDFEPGQNKNIKVTFTFEGRDFDYLDAGDAPNFTDVTYSTVAELTLVDGALMINGVDYVNAATSAKWTLDFGGEATPSLGRKAIDVFLGLQKFTGEIVVHRTDTVLLQSFNDEDDIAAFFVCAENDTDPKDFISFYFGNLGLGAPSKNIAAQGGLFDSFPLYGGIDESGTDRKPCTVLISTSAA